jgi:hypothetical protein
MLTTAVQTSSIGIRGVLRSITVEDVNNVPLQNRQAVFTLCMLVIATASALELQSLINC